MRRKYPHVGVGTLCGLFGKTQNALYDHQRRATAPALLDGLVLALVAGLREHLPHLGTYKLHFLLLPRLGEYAPQVGRDYLSALLAGRGLLICRRKRRVVTTQLCLPLFRRPNLTEHLTVHRAEQVWVSDITHVRLLSGWSYRSLITGSYSHKIVGACLHPDLSVRGTLSALHQALAARTYSSSGTVSLVFPASFCTQNGGAPVGWRHVDFGDGRGYVHFVEGQTLAASYPTAGTKRIRVRFSYYSGTSYESHFDVQVTGVSNSAVVTQIPAGARGTTAFVGRPRIDVTTRISGFFRDAFPHLIELLADAVQLVLALDEPLEDNFVRKHYLRDLAELQVQEMPLEEAEQRAAYRIFGAPPGSYGAGILPLINEKNWHADADFAQAYVNWGGYAYTRSESGTQARAEFRQRLSGVEVALHNQDNREHDIFDSDDYLQFYGGMIATIRSLTGQQPKHCFGDTQDPARPAVRDLKEEVLRVFRSRVVNPKWLAGIQRHGYKGGLELTATVDHLFGYDATAHVVDDWMYEQVAETYALAAKHAAVFCRQQPLGPERHCRAAARSRQPRPVGCPVAGNTGRFATGVPAE